MARVLSPVVAVLAVGVLLAGARATSAQVLCRGEADDVAALRSFYRAVNEYVDLRQWHDDPMSPERLCSNPEAIAEALDRLAVAVAAERVGMEGAVFTPEVADFFRVRLALVGQPPPAIGPAPRVEPHGVVPAPVVNTRLAWGAGVPIDATIARVLPELPWPLEYWISGPAASLVILDATTGLIVDVLAEPWPACAS